MQVMIKVRGGGLGIKEVELSGVTTVHYAAKRAAEEFGLDGDAYWGFAKGRVILPNDDLIMDYTDQLLELALLGETSG